jgi:DNA invertase Pin-like site-specific DNA recombinase
MRRGNEMNVVGYVRLSRDEDKENYSSIISQQDIINEYAKSKNWEISKMYIDDNYSGYTLDRLSFNEMIENTEDGNIDVIISKDLSRIGRNNGKVLVLIDRLKELGVRLILINEGNGGLDLLEDDHDILGIKTWYNEMYVKDISRKVKATMHSKQKSGELIMGNFYGYKKVKINGRFQLVVDEDIKPVIELIFKCYLEGLGYKRICDILDENGYPTPSEYIKKRHENNGRVFKNTTTNKWQTHMVQRIIQNDIYIGTLRTKKKRVRLIKGKQEKVPKEEQYVFINNHNSMIGEETFRLAQEINSKRKKKVYRNSIDKYNYIFSGFMRCGDCGYTVLGLNLRKAPVITRGYNCAMYTRYGKKRCETHAIKEEKLLFFFKEFLKDVKSEYEDNINNINIKEKKNNVEKALSKCIKDLEIANEELKLLLTQKIKDLIKESNIKYKEIVENSYNEIEAEKKKRILELTQKVRELQRVNNNDIGKIIKSNLEIFDLIINSQRPERKYLEMILDKITVYSDRSLEFKLKVNIDKLTCLEV